MAMFEGRLPLYGYEVTREGEDNVMRVNYEGAPMVPSIEDNPLVMTRTCDNLVESKNATKIVFSQKRDYEYDYNQTALLKEIAMLYDKLSRQKELFTLQSFQVDEASKQFANKWYTETQKLVFQQLRADPIGMYVELRRLAREERISMLKLVDEKLKPGIEHYIQLLTYILGLLEKTRLITIAKPFLAGYKLGDREIYRNFLHPIIKPDFMWTKLMANYPPEGEEIDSYTIGEDTEITIFSLPESVQYIYHMTPPEFKLTEDQYELLDMARNILAEHKPTRQEFTDPARMREIFSNVGKDLLGELVIYKNLQMSEEEIDKLAKILVRYTIGFGLIEVLLQDDKIQDISVNSPQGRLPVFIVHADYTDCITNIIPTTTEAESWATKLRMVSGRPLDEANVILDTELELPGASVRVSTITRPLDPTGLAFSFRRHRDKPWTLPLYIKYKMITPLAAGLLSFLIDGTRSMMVCGTRSSGKSSFLSALLIEMMRRYRIITIEDSVAKDSKILIQTRGETRFSKIGDIFDEIGGARNIGEREVIRLNDSFTPTISKNGKSEFKRVTALIRHKVKKPMYEVVTRTGRLLKITGDHSIFKLASPGNGLICEEKTSNLKTGDRIAVPRSIHLPEENVRVLDCWEKLNALNPPESQAGRIYLKLDKNALERHVDAIKKEGCAQGYTRAAVNRWLRFNWLPFRIARTLPLKTGSVEQFKYGLNSKGIDVRVALDKDLMSLLGLWLADGCFDTNSVIFSVSSREERALVKSMASRFGFSTKMHSDEFSLMINSASFKFLIATLFHLEGNAYTKKIPVWVMQSRRELKAAFLKGLFSGDGCVSDKEIIIGLASMELLDDIQTLMLNFGVIFRINRLRMRKSKLNDSTRDGRISSQESINKFRKEIGFLQKRKNAKLNALSRRITTHASSDSVALDPSLLRQLSAVCPRNVFNKHDYIGRNNALGIEKTRRISDYLSANGQKELARYLRMIAESDLFWDEVASIRPLRLKNEYVYDLSVPGAENFIANNILAHNTLELPTNSMRQLGFNIQPMKVASALARGSSEMSAADGIRSTLRLGDSALIVGEVRSGEAKALYEAMRVGAAANVVAGTIHADSPYGLFDRVVNDIGIPKTSFKATDILIIANPIKSADGLHRVRRVTQITEVRKTWEDDPMLEHGFVDLMKYDPKTDQLVATDEMLDGDSEILKAIAANVTDFAGNWDALYNDITTRAEIKEMLVNKSKEMNDPDMLEAPFVIKCNDKFHLLCEEVKELKGKLDHAEIKRRWVSWLERELKKRKLNKGQTEFNPYGLSY
jgi:type IV secretory pathway ATPase VirB11/archaellum biosynthesis ATPase